MEQNNALARKFNAASLLRFALPNIAMKQHTLSPRARHGRCFTAAKRSTRRFAARTQPSICHTYKSLLLS